MIVVCLKGDVTIGPSFSWEKNRPDHIRAQNRLSTEELLPNAFLSRGARVGYRVYGYLCCPKFHSHTHTHTSGYKNPKPRSAIQTHEIGDPFCCGRSWKVSKIMASPSQRRNTGDQPDGGPGPVGSPGSWGKVGGLAGNQLPSQETEQPTNHENVYNFHL